MSAEPRLDVAIVSFRSRDRLRACLASVRAFGPVGGARIVVVDNDSRDGTGEMVGTEFPEVELIQSGSNLGFAAATNRAIRAGGAPYVLVLNPDTAVAEGGLDVLIAVLEREAEAGLVGCRLVREDGSFDHAAKRSFPTALGALAHFAGRESQYRAPAHDEHEAGPVDAINGAFMLIRRSALDEVGLFDEGYWMYMEDLDLCYRMHQAGWTCWYEPSVAVLHAKGASAERRASPRLLRAFHYGMFRFYRAHYAPHRSPLLNMAVYAAIWLKLGLALLRSIPLKIRLARLDRRARRAVAA